MIETDIVVGAELRITCAKDALAQALGVVARALSTRSSVQILSGILLEARDGDLQLAATDMELSLRASLSAQVDGDGAIVVPGKTLVDIALTRSNRARAVAASGRPQCGGTRARRRRDRERR